MRPRIAALLLIWCTISTLLALWPLQFDWNCVVCRNGVDADMSSGRLSFQSHGMALASVPASFNRDLAESGAMSVEMWLTPANVEQSGLARIITYSSGLYRRNFTIGQYGDSIVIRLRTSVGDLNGRWRELVVPEVFAPDRHVHILMLLNAEGTRVAIDGIERISSESYHVNFSAWATNFDLIIGNELTGDRPWLGFIERITIRNGAEGQRLADFVFTPGTKTTSNVVQRTDLTSPPYYSGFVSSFQGDADFRLTDFVLHVGMLVPVGFLGLLLPARHRSGVRRTLVSMLLVMVFALGVECAQHLTVNRTPSILDWLSGFAGGLIGAAAARILQLRLERVRAPQP